MGKTSINFKLDCKLIGPHHPLKITFSLITSQPELQMTREGYILYQHIELYQIPLNMIFSTEIGGPMDLYIRMAAPSQAGVKFDSTNQRKNKRLITPSANQSANKRL